MRESGAVARLNAEPNPVINAHAHRWRGVVRRKLHTQTIGQFVVLHRDLELGGADGCGTRRRDALLGSFGPFSVLAMLFNWVVLLLLGYGLLLDSMRDQIRPPPPGFGTSLYFAATSMFTIGFGDYVATSAPAGSA